MGHFSELNIWSFYPFRNNLGTPMPTILDNQLLEVPQNAFNGLLWYENRVVGTKISIVARLLRNIWSFYPFWTNFGAILATLGAKF